MYDYNDKNHKDHSYGTNVPKYDIPNQISDDESIYLSPMTES